MIDARQHAHIVIAQNACIKISCRCKKSVEEICESMEFVITNASKCATEQFRATPTIKRLIFT